MGKANNVWQPIETAPKDGTYFLAYCDEEDEEDNGFYGMCVLFYKAESDVFLSDIGDGYIVFSHWMPLPPPPTT